MGLVTSSHQLFFSSVAPRSRTLKGETFHDWRYFFILPRKFTDAVRGVAMAVCASHRSRHRNVRGDVCKVGTTWGVT